MLKSRRGLLAAGLAVAVVGATGVASTLTAGAEQIPDIRPAAAAATGIPPALLPWGERPEKIRKGRAGASAKTLKAEGLDAAANDTSGSTQPRGRYAPKGVGERPGVKPPEPPGPPAPSEPTPGAGATPTDDTDPTPPSDLPTPPTTTSPTTTATTDATDDPTDPSTTDPTASATVSAVAPAPTVTGSSSTSAKYLYAGGYQKDAVTAGMYANLSISKPTLATSDYHTLAELALQSADQTQTVEIGWNIDRTVNGDDDPHLFVYHWVNDKATCYNGCGFVQYAGASIMPGATLAYGVSKKFAIQYAGNAWWVAFDSEWIGYFPESLWLNQGVSSFATSGYIQVFGEVASPTTTPCGTQMGNGLAPVSTTDATAALVGSTTYLSGPTVLLTTYSNNTIYPMYFVLNTATGLLSPRTFRYGGPDKTTKTSACYVAPTTS